MMRKFQVIVIVAAFQTQIRYFWQSRSILCHLDCSDNEGEYENEWDRKVEYEMNNKKMK
jgi:hypothetical protein